MGAGASASVEGGRTVSDELFGKLDEAKAGVLTLVERGPTAGEASNVDGDHAHPYAALLLVN